MIGKRLKYVRTFYGDRQIDLAAKCNVSLSTVKSWEGDNSSPSYEMLAHICKLYHVPADYLIGVIDDDPLVEKASQEKLSPQNKAFVRLFEEFILYKQQKEAKK